TCRTSSPVSLSKYSLIEEPPAVVPSITCTGLSLMVMAGNPPCQLLNSCLICAGNADPHPPAPLPNLPRSAASAAPACLLPPPSPPVRRTRSCCLPPAYAPPWCANPALSHRFPPAPSQNRYRIPCSSPWPRNWSASPLAPPHPMPADICPESAPHSADWQPHSESPPYPDPPVAVSRIAPPNSASPRAADCPDGRCSRSPCALLQNPPC